MRELRVEFFDDSFVGEVAVEDRVGSVGAVAVQSRGGGNVVAFIAGFLAGQAR